MCKSLFLGALTAALSSLLPPPYSPAPSEGQTWVLLVAGSSGWFNYRHQADVCHAYQIAAGHGVPQDNIILMMYDDIASNRMNPTPGVIINAPNGTNVYAGLPKDYNGEHNNPHVFLNVLEGIDPRLGSRRVIRSGPRDRIFVYFTDHGAPGIISFGSGGILKSQDLMRTIERMHARKQFSEMVFYVEACESGSMFSKPLPKGVYAMTASNSREPSYACYYSPSLRTYLGDLFSVNWMEDSDIEDLRKESIEMQFRKVKRETDLSHVSQYGDRSVSRAFLAQFMGGRSSHPSKPTQHTPKNPISSRKVNMDLIVKSKNILLYSFTRAKRIFVRDSLFQILRTIEAHHGGPASIRGRIPFFATDQLCYFSSISAIHEHCFNLGIHTYATQFLYMFVNLCYRAPKGLTEDIATSVKSVCRDYTDIHRIL